MYAQINYTQRLGNGPFTIAEAGCLLVAVSNLFTRFGITIDPPTLNEHYKIYHKYIDVDGDNTLDDLTWGAPSNYDPQTISTELSKGPGWPNSNNAIVKFVYKSPRSGKTVTHFALVADFTKGLIVDSWDGTIKVSPYGTPVAWAKYERHAPQVIVPPPPPPQPSYSVELIPETTKYLKIDTKMWDLNRRSWPDMVNNPIEDSPRGKPFKTKAIGRHILGGSYYLLDPGQSGGYNIVDCSDTPVVAPSPAPIPAPVSFPPAVPTPPEPKLFTENTVDGIRYEAFDKPQQRWIKKQGGTEKWSFANVVSWRDFKSVQHVEYGAEVFISGVAHHPILPNGADYYMVVEDFGDFKRTGHVNALAGFNWADLSTTRPPTLAPIAVVPPPPDSLPAPASAVADLAPPQIDFRATYRAFVDANGMKKPERYVAMKNYVVRDLEGKRGEVPLNKYDYVTIGGTFVKDGRVYGRPEDAAAHFTWHGIPMDGDEQGEKLIEPYADIYNTSTTTATRQVTHTLKPYDYFVLGIANFRKIAGTIGKVWDIVPSNKNQKTK